MYSDYLGTRKQQARSARVRDRGGVLQPGGKWWLLQGADCKRVRGCRLGILRRAM
ncbi:hypothetical protein [Klebsiella phage vB_KshKPC-M]|nr:hypothetical protein [Klebsiella phage vB_KshKPC-M]